MVKSTTFLTFEQILTIHDNQVELYGGSHGLRDLALFESAVMRLQVTFGGEDLYPSLFQKSAVLIHSLIMNHPFVDGNKRTGIVAGLIFLEINNIRIIATQKELVQLSLQVESKRWNLNRISSWLEDHSKKI